MYLDLPPATTPATARERSFRSSHHLVRFPTVSSKPNAVGSQNRVPRRASGKHSAAGGLREHCARAGTRRRNSAHGSAKGGRRGCGGAPPPQGAPAPPGGRARMPRKCGSTSARWRCGRASCCSWTCAAGPRGRGPACSRGRTARTAPAPRRGPRPPRPRLPPPWPLCPRARSPQVPRHRLQSLMIQRWRHHTPEFHVHHAGAGRCHHPGTTRASEPRSPQGGHPQNVPTDQMTLIALERQGIEGIVPRRIEVGLLRARSRTSASERPG